LPNWPTLAETVIEIQKSRECSAQEAREVMLEDLISRRRHGRGALFFPREVRRGYLRDYPIGGGDPTIVPISVNYWLAVKHGTGRASVDYTTSKGSGGPPAGAGQYLEIWISPEGAGEAPGPSALTLGVPPVTAMPPVKLLATCCRTYVAATDTGLTPAIAASPPPEPGRPLSVDWGLTALTPHGAGFAVAQDAQRDDSGLATTRNRGECR
jgi:hypothetical protein